MAAPVHTDSIVQLAKVRDEQFNIDEISNYQLNMLISQHFFRLCIADTRTNKCLQLEEYKLSPSFSPQQFCGFLDTLFDEHHLLQAGYWKTVKVSFKNDKYSLIPHTLFQETHANEYLELNSEIDIQQERVLSYRHPGREITNVFAASSMVIDWLKNRYPNKEVLFVNQASADIEGILALPTPAGQKALYLFADETHLTVIVKKDNRLLFCNTFYTVSEEDVLYYVMLVMDEMKTDPQTTPVSIWGTYDEKSPVFKLLFTYIKNLKLGTRPGFLKFGFVFDELPEHRFFDLYALYLC